MHMGMIFFIYFFFFFWGPETLNKLGGSPGFWGDRQRHASQNLNLKDFLITFTLHVHTLTVNTVPERTHLGNIFFCHMPFSHTSKIWVKLACNIFHTFLYISLVTWWERQKERLWNMWYASFLVSHTGKREKKKKEESEVTEEYVKGLHILIIYMTYIKGKSSIINQN